MALGAGLAFLMAVSLTGCEMDRMDLRRQQMRRLKIRRMKRKRQNPEITGPGKYQKKRPGRSGPGRRQSRRRPLGRTRSQMSRCLWRPGGAMTGNGRTERCLLRSRWDGLDVLVDGWDTLKDGLSYQ